jgi:hypothetical protein
MNRKSTFRGFRSILAGATRHLDPTLAAPIFGGVVAALAYYAGVFLAILG